MVIALGLTAFVVFMAFAGLMEWRAYRKKKRYGRNLSISGKHKRDHQRRDRKTSG